MPRRARDRAAAVRTTSGSRALPTLVFLGLLVTAIAALVTIAGCGDTGLQVRGAAPDSSADAITRITGCTGRGEHAPSRLTIRCSKPPTVLQNLRWRGWGGATATATGTLVIAGCPPGGPRCGGAAQVVASHLVLGARAAQYEALTVHTGRGTERTTTDFDVDDRGPTKR